MTSNVNNNFNYFPAEMSDHIFGYLSSSDLGHTASTSEEMYALSLSQRLKKAQETIKEAPMLFQGIIQLPSFDTMSQNLKDCNASICSIQQKIKSIPVFQEIFVKNHGDFNQIAQEIRDRDLVIVLKQIAPPEIQQKMDGLSNFQAAAFARNWLKNLDPRDSFFQIVDLQLPNLRLTSIPPEIFTYFPNLQTLNLSNNDIQVIPTQIDQLQNLRKLYLSDNQIQVLPPEIGGLLNLQKLYLSDNQIQVLPSEIGRLLNLRKLYLSDNQIQVLPPEIGGLLNLRKLYLSDNQIQVLPLEIGGLLNLQTLYLEKNQILVIPPQIGQLQNLQMLYLDNNQIQILPPEIGGLQNLQKLYLNGNQILVIPSEIGQLLNLQVLSLNRNQIQAIPPQITQLQNLQWLDLCDNQIQVLPPEIGRLLNLQTLYLEKNQIKALPVEIEQLQNLNSLFIQNNPIKIIPYQIIYKLQNLLGNKMIAVSNIDRLKGWAYIHRPSKTACAVCVATFVITLSLFQMLYSDPVLK